VSHISFWRQIGGRDRSRIRIESQIEHSVGSASPLGLVLPAVVVIWNRMQFNALLVVVVVALGARHHPRLDGIDWKEKSAA